MCAFGRLAVVALLVAAVASPGLARMATIEATAPLRDHSERSVQAALVAAVGRAIDRAMALGFSRIAIGRAFVLKDRVSVQILASDTDLGEDEDDEDEEADPGLGGGHGQPARLEL